jgi:hypothetical protein
VTTPGAFKEIVLKGHNASYRISSIRMLPDGSVTVRVRVSDAGLVGVMLSACKDNIATAASVLTPAPGRIDLHICIATSSLTCSVTTS